MKKIYILSVLILSSFSIFGQCYPDRHSTNWFDAWVSCEMTNNPNPNNEASHWIMYDLGIAYQLGTSTIWNINDPKHLDDGINHVLVEHSNDGVNWTSLDTFEVAQASGRSVYEGIEGPDFEDEIARYILFTAIDNHGGDCTGFSEIKIQVEKVTTTVLNNEASTKCMKVNISPNPFWEEANISIMSDCIGLINYTVYDMLGKVVINGNIASDGAEKTVNLQGASLKPGSYVIKFIQNDQILSKSFFKLNNYE